MKYRSPGTRGLALAVPFILAAVPATAYVGPGAGVTMLGALWGLIVAVAAALGFLVMWPLRRYIFKRKRVEASSGRESPARQATANRPRSP